MPSDLPRFVFDLLGAVPGRGDGLNLWLFRVARVLHPFRAPEEIVELLYAATAGEQVRHGEIERAVERSKSCAWQPGAPPQQRVASVWPKLNRTKRASVAASGSLADLWERSPIRLDGDDSRTEEIIDALFPGNPLLCVGRSQSCFWTRSRDELKGELSSLSVVVPSPMTARTGKTQDDKFSAHALSITGPRRFLVIEQDNGLIDEQAAILLHLAQFAPLALAVHSGGKSIHGWFVCGNECEATLLAFMRYAVGLGADPATWTRSQFVRMPDGCRNDGKRQSVFYFDPDQLE
jgi:hypothetical protein